MSCMLCPAGVAKAKAQAKAPAAKVAQPAPPKQQAQPKQQALPKQPAPSGGERVEADAVQRGMHEIAAAFGAFGNVPRSAAPDIASSNSAATQQLPQPNKAPALATPSQVRPVLHFVHHPCSEANLETLYLVH